MTDEEKLWAILWAGLAVTVTAAEVYALKSKKPHAPLSHHLRRAPLGHTVGELLFAWGAIKFHRHLWPRML